MSMYETGTVSAATDSTTIDGTGTAWLDRKFGISPQCTLAVYGNGTVDLYAIRRVDSDIRLTVTRPVSTAFTGKRYGIMVAETQSVQYWANMLTASLGYQQALLDNLQTIMTGTGSVTITAPDGQQVTVSSFKKLDEDIRTVAASGWGGQGIIISQEQYPSLGDIHTSSVFQGQCSVPGFSHAGAAGVQSGK